MNEDLSAYATGGHRRVEGWLDSLALQAIVRLAQRQEQIGISGSVCEIGVHHGRLFILLHLLSRPGETSVAYDLFENQSENTDQSGKGDTRALLRNLKVHNCALSRIKVVAENSLRLTPARILQDCGLPPRLFSIDGGHSAEMTINDLRLATSAVCRGGLIIVDDFFNEAWPGVAEGTCRFFFEKDCTLQPVLISGNKFIFTNDDGAAEVYRCEASAMRGSFSIKRSQVFGNDVVVLVAKRYRSAMHSALAQTKLWSRIRGTPLGALVRRVVRSY